MTRWTDRQLEAIVDRGRNLLVAAAAGSGKTAVLTERIIRLVGQEHIDIDRLLIVTFTQAAAGEMRARISTRLQEAMQEEGAEQEFLRRQIALINRASISTLHSFCLDVVRRYFHIIDISPAFRVGDATETALLKLEVLEELFEARYQQADPGFLALVETYAGGRDDTPLRELVLRTYEFIQSQPHPLAWLDEKVGYFTLEEGRLENSPWVESLRQQLSMDLDGAEETFRMAAAMAAQPGGPAVYIDALETDMALVCSLRASLEQGMEAFYLQLRDNRHSRLAPAGKEVDQELKMEVQEMRDQGKKLISGMSRKILFMSPAQFCQDLQEMHPGMAALALLVGEFHQRYREHKNERGLVDFNDLEHYALEILDSPLTAMEYRRQFEYIFVDEYQDSNLVQETIINRIKREDNLFLVGDVKQSIYRFRMADPSIFLAKYEAYHEPQGRPDKRIDLSANFRSRRTIIDGVNDIFSRLMSRQLGEMDYQPEAFLEYGLQFPPQEGEELGTGCLELLLIDKGDAGTGPEAAEQEEGNAADQSTPDMAVEELEEEPGDIEFEALMVAARIKEMHGQQFYDSKRQCCRPLEYRDMVVLMRAARGQADIYYETLMGAGIPVYADVDRGYFETAEMKVFISLLQLIDNKRQDIPLLSVMRSPIGRFTVEELVAIRAASPAPTFYEALEEYMGCGEDELAQKLDAFIARLNTWKEAAAFLPMDELIWRLLLETGFLHYAAAMPGGRQRQANLRILLERGRQYQDSSMQGLFHFLKFIEKLESSSSDLGMARTLGESEDVVRIMSIHKSKGLEFPVVIVAGLGRKFNLSDTRAQVLFHNRLGIGPKYVDPELRVTRDTIVRAALAGRIRAESLAEEMRILYVALTRPRDKLILAGTVDDLARSVRRWERGTSPFHLARARGLLDWLGAVLLKHADGAGLRGYETAWLESGPRAMGRGAEQPAPAGERTGPNTPGTDGPGMTAAAGPAGSRGAQDRFGAIGEETSPGQAMETEAQVTAAAAEHGGNGYRWSISIIGRSRSGMAQADVQARSAFRQRLQAAVLEDKELRGHIRARLDWQYPCAATINIPSKLSVSQVNQLAPVSKSSPPGGARPGGGRQHWEPAAQGLPLLADIGAEPDPGALTGFRQPRFMAAGGLGETGFSPAERGTILHKVMQLLDLAEVGSPAGIERQLGQMVEREILLPEEAAVVDTSSIVHFFGSSLGRRLLAADRVQREVPFNLLYDAAEIFPGVHPGREQLLLQGVIDVYFQEGDELVLVDYKSDRVTPSNRETLIAAYRGQVELYRMALEKILGQRVKASYLYLFDLGQAVQLL